MMTTIATDGVTIAGDGRATANGTVSSDQVIKVHRLPHGRAVGSAGEATKGLIAIRALQAGEDLSGLDLEGVYLVVIDGTNTVQSYEETANPLELPTPYAIGSGRDVALGALDAGASPKEAVAIAIKRDVFTGGRIRTVTVKQ